MSKRVAVIAATGEVVNIKVCADNYQTQPYEVEDNGEAYLNGDYVNGYFYAPQPFPSWTRNEGEWMPPVPMPADNSGYMWDENSVSWVKVEEAL